MTDDQGRYVVPDLPIAKYKVWVRGYGLVDLREGGRDTWGQRGFILPTDGGIYLGRTDAPGSLFVGYQSAYTVSMGSDGIFGWSSSASSAVLFKSNLDVILSRDAANTLALRNSTNAQKFSIYNTYTDASNYERAGISWSGNTAYLFTEKAGTGSNRGLVIYSGGLNRFFHGRSWYSMAG